jgi:hypothetical protein
MPTKIKAGTNLDLVLDAIRYHEIKTVRVRVAGNNDDGGIDQIYVNLLDPTDDEADIGKRLIDSVKITTLALLPEHAPYDAATGGRRDWLKKPPTLREAIEIVCYDILDTEAEGYECGPGAHGIITLTPLGPFMPEPVDKVTFEIHNHYADDYDEDDEDDEEYYNDEGPGD